MKRISGIALLAMAFACGGACASHNVPSEPSSPGEASKDSFAVVAEQCVVVTSIEVVHRVNGSPVTERLRLTDEASSDPALSLRSFQVAANYFGAANVISSRPISQVQCFPEAAAASNTIVRQVGPTPGSSLCVDWDNVLDCTPATPSHTYDYAGTESCTSTLYSEAVSISCADSNAIVTKRGDVVLTVNTQNLRNDVLARTQALRRMVGDTNIVTNFHFDIVLTPDQRASIVSNDAYASIAQQIKQASDSAQPLPDIQGILRNLPQPPTNVDFYTQMVRAYQLKLDRQILLAKITSGALLSPQQVNAFYQRFITDSRRIDQLEVEHSASALNQASGILNGTIAQLATTAPSSTIYNQVKAGAQSMLTAHTTLGVFDPDHVIDFVVPDLHQSLTNEDIQKRLVASDMLIEFNEALRRDGGKERAAAMAGPLGLLALALENDDMERAFRLYDQVQATEFYFDNSDPSGTSYDVHLTPEAQAMFNIAVQPNSAVAYEVIGLLNETADYNLATGKVTIDVKAVITVNARQALSSNEIKRALYHTEESYGVLNFLKSGGVAFLGGALKELGGTVTGIFHTSVAAWSDPDAFVDHLGSAVANWRQTLDIVLQQGVEVIDRWPGMTLEEKSELLGRVATQVLLSLPSEAKQAGRINQAVEDAARLLLDKAARGLKIVERGGVALTAEAAVELVKRFERYEISSIDEVIKVADSLDDLLPCSIVGGNSFRQAASLGAKPPCGVTHIASAFDELIARAQKAGFTSTADLHDIFTSRSVIGRPGRVVKNAMLEKEYEFAERIVRERGGVFVGNRETTRQAIDGFFGGVPTQIKSLTTDKPLKVLRRVGDTETAAKGAKVSNVHIILEAPNVSADELLDFVRTGPMLSITRAGVVSSVEIFVEGRWIRIVDGVVQ